MRLTGGSLIAWCLAGSVLVLCQAAPKPSAGDTTTPNIPGVVAGGTNIQLLQRWDPALGGEGSVATPDGGVLFVQQDEKKILKIDKDGKFSTYLENTNRPTGLAFDRQRRLIAVGGARGGQPRVEVLVPTPSVVADKFEGQSFNAPNDLIIDRKGGIYFTDSESSIVYYVKPGGQLMKVTGEVEGANGIQLSPDEKVLYIGSNPEQVIKAFDVQADASLHNLRTFATAGGPDGAVLDGLTVDSTGRLYATDGNSVVVFSRMGQRLGLIPFPTRAGNLAFSGPDKKTLFVVGRGAIYKIAMLSSGLKDRSK